MTDMSRWAMLESLVPKFPTYLDGALANVGRDFGEQEVYELLDALVLILQKKSRMRYYWAAMPLLLEAIANAGVVQVKERFPGDTLELARNSATFHFITIKEQMNKVGVHWGFKFTGSARYNEGPVYMLQRSGE